MVLFGYIKANKLASEYILRQDMLEKEKATKIAKETYETKQFEISDETGTKKIILKDIINISGEEIEINNEGDILEKHKLWVTMTNDSVEPYINTLLKDYKSRTKFIDAILTKLIDNNINGISIDFQKIDSDNMMRFIIELTPKLREVGITTCMVLNNMNEQDYINIVDYIVE